MSENETPDTSGLPPQAVEALGQLGIDPQQALAFLQPLVVGAVRQTINEMKLPDLIAGAVKQQVDQKGGEIAQMVVQQLQQAQQAPAPHAQHNGSGGTESLIAAALPALIKAISGGGSGGGDMAQMATFAKGMGELFQNFMVPVMSIFSEGEKHAINSITAASRIGWLPDRPPTAAAAAASLSEPEPGQSAADLAQKLTYGTR